LFGEEMSLWIPTQLCQDGSRNWTFFRRAGHLFQRTCRFADVVLPASPSLEKKGTFTTRKANPAAVQVFEPLEGSRPDWPNHPGHRQSSRPTWQ